MAYDGRLTMQPLKNLIKSEAVRTYLYGIAAAVVALLVFLGAVNAETGLYVSAVVAAIISIPVTEVTRASVYSTNTFRSTVDTALHTDTSEVGATA